MTRLTLEEIAQGGGFQNVNQIIRDKMDAQVAARAEELRAYLPPKVTWRTRYSEAKRRLRDAYAVLRHGAFLDNDDMW